MIKPGFEVDNAGGKFRGSGPFGNTSGGSGVIKRLKGMTESTEEYISSRRKCAKEVDISEFKGMKEYDIFRAAMNAKSPAKALAAVAALEEIEAFDKLLFLMRHCSNPAAIFAAVGLYKKQVHSAHMPDYVEMGIVAYFVRGKQKKILLDILKEACLSQEPQIRKAAEKGLEMSKTCGDYLKSGD